MSDLLDAFKDYILTRTRPWEIRNWRGTDEDIERRRKISEKYRMTAPEVVPIYTRRPF